VVYKEEIMMVLVSYSDSEGSEGEEPQPTPKKNTPASMSRPDTKFTIDKHNPRRIRVNLEQIIADSATNGGQEEEPAPKRPKIGGGFSGFNFMLPTPKRETQAANGAKTASTGAPRKIFSLKTGAEPGFSRESDAELRQLFAEQGTDSVDDGLGGSKRDGTEMASTDKGLALPPISQPSQPKQGTPMMFKPLSVAKNTQKKKASAKTTPPASASQAQFSKPAPAYEASASAPKVSLFSMGTTDEPTARGPQQAEYEPLVYQSAPEDDHATLMPNENEDRTSEFDSSATDPAPAFQSQSLDSIAADLNLSPSAKRQLLGRNHKNASKVSSSIINFNTDQEYAANESLRASGEQVQHNPVRAIAPGKHSLKQLVNAASGQKEALEESFASGRKNKKEASGKYGW
jgi:Mitotic checkpoint regulator, MAD2B-interacting